MGRPQPLSSRRPCSAAGFPTIAGSGRESSIRCLVTRGETARTFRLGIGIDVPNPLAAALGFLAPPLVLPDQPPTPTPTGWLFHLDCRNVLATALGTLVRRRHHRRRKSTGAYRPPENSLSSPPPKKLSLPSDPVFAFVS